MKRNSYLSPPLSVKPCLLATRAQPQHAKTSTTSSEMDGGVVFSTLEACMTKSARAHHPRTLPGLLRRWDSIARSSRLPRGRALPEGTATQGEARRGEASTSGSGHDASGPFHKHPNHTCIHSSLFLLLSQISQFFPYFQILPNFPIFPIFRGLERKFRNLLSAG